MIRSAVVAAYTRRCLRASKMASAVFSLASAAASPPNCDMPRGRVPV